MVGLPFKEIGDVFVYCHLRRVIHCFEGFWRNTAEARCLPLFQFVDGMLNLSEGDWRINGSTARFLPNEIKFQVIDMYVVAQDLVEIHTEDRHTFLGIGG